MTVASWEPLPETAVDQQGGRHWWICTCGRPLWEHPWINTDGNRWRSCGLNGKGRFESETRAVEYDPAGGLRVRAGYTPEPTLG